MSTDLKRAILIVCDSVGVGAASDAAQFGDTGSNTLGNISLWFERNKKQLSLPNLSNWGLDQIVSGYGIEKNNSPLASTAILEELSPGKDTTTGHWEIAGTVLKKQFPTFPKGFPEELLKQWTKENNLVGWLGNKIASGTTVIDELGPEHIKTGKPILYTSADSVLQVACSEEHFGLERLYEICVSARKLVDPLGVGRVIARPFTGNKLGEFMRTENRKDYSVPPPSPNLLDLLRKKDRFVAGVGKIEDIFAHRSVNLVDHTGNNKSSMAATLKFIKETKGQSGLIFTNLIDFDQHFGHRRDPEGYGKCLMEFDAFLPELEKSCTEEDLVLITADHGNDPTHTGSDHTRENVPLLVWSKNKKFNPKQLGKLSGYHHISKIILEALGLKSCVPELSDLQPLDSQWEKLWEN